MERVYISEDDVKNIYDALFEFIKKDDEERSAHFEDEKRYVEQHPELFKHFKLVGPRGRDGWMILWIHEAAKKVISVISSNTDEALECCDACAYELGFFDD